MAIDLTDHVVATSAQGPVISARDVRVWYGTTRGAIRGRAPSLRLRFSRALAEGNVRFGLAPKPR